MNLCSEASKVMSKVPIVEFFDVGMDGSCPLYQTTHLYRSVLYHVQYNICMILCVCVCACVRACVWI